jgi:IS30 family transposase
MNTRCTVCRHPQRAEIEEAHVVGATLRDIGKRFNRSKTTIQKHIKLHVPAAAQKRPTPRTIARSTPATRSSLNLKS